MTHRILCDGRGFYFTDRAGVGAIVVTRRGGSVSQPSRRHPVWRAIDLWRGQGRNVGADGTCLWGDPRPARFERVIRKVA